MPDSALFLSTARGEVRVATELVIDPDFGPVHLLRVSSAAGPGGGLTDAELRAAAVHTIIDSMPGGAAGLTDTELRATPVGVDVGNWPVGFLSGQSGAWNVGVNNFPAGFNVNNWPATQPVSLAAVPSHAVTGPLTNAELRAAGVPVLGTFWQATQPVSGTFWQATQPVSGTFWQATQPVSGPVTDAQLRAAAVPVSGPLTDAQLRASAVPVSMGAASVLFKGRVCTFNTPGRAGTAGQKILSIHNATGSSIKIYVTKVLIDLAMTVVKAVTVPPFPIRLYKVTVLPTNGTALVKTKIGGTGASDAAVTVRGDASADSVSSGTTLTATLPAGAIITQEFAPRLITAAGYEMADRIEFLESTEVELGALEGLVLHLEYTLATQNVVSDRWIAGLEWYEK